MQGVWINVECLKCGNKKESKYFIENLKEMSRVYEITCSCGNEDCEHFKLLEIDNQRGFLQ
ncbi:hypothetical protein KY334_01275 [Candidatus Woesearchaeota archaeon]|nr:hypothetical protein [Candidatus Woesearchaeota archaeon]